MVFARSDADRFNLQSKSVIRAEALSRFRAVERGDPVNAI
jgi:hypothetical protein